ncbi:MAG TPA: PAS-domain containing protein, partial [Alphaproteobacteria bacterium]|nr:PAS-domain containing protein [Alphaproteobacteria bacterium]
MADAPGRADILEGHRHGLPAGGEGLALLPTIASFWLGMATSLLLGILALPSLRAAVAAADPVWVAGLGGAGAATTVVALGIVLLRGGEAARRLTLAQGRIADLERIRADIVPISMILLDPEDRIVWWNDKFLGFLSPPERAVLRRGLLFEDALLRWCELADFQFQGLTGAPAAQARLAYHRDYAGPFEECWGPWVRTSEHRTPDGGTLIMHVEIGDVKARERQLAEEAAQARIASVLENVLAMILVLDADDRVVYWNRNYTANMSPEVGALVERGITLETLLERFAAEDRRSDPDNRRPHFDHSRRLARHRHYDGPFEEHLPDGRVLWTIEHRMPDGGTIILSTDITGVKRVEAELRASEQRLRTIFQHSPIALAVTAEARETVLLANGRFAEMVERPVGAVAGREMAELFGGDAPFTRLRMLL